MFLSVHVRPARRRRPPNRPDPHQDRPATGADAPSRTGRLLGLVRTLIDYGRQLAATLQQRTSATNLADVTRHFGTIDIGEILARITRGLLRAAALETRLIQPPRPRAGRTGHPSAPSPRQPRAARPWTEAPAPPTHVIARLPTPEDIAAEVRRRPVGAVIADICRDLGIVPSNPLWRELSLAIIGNGGNLATLVKDIWQAAQRVADRSARRRASRGAGTGPAIRGDARHRPALNRISDHRGVTHGAGPRLVPLS